jgi:ankyrin repeat protein
MNKLSINLFVLFFITAAVVSASDPPVFKYIINNDLPAISEFIQTNDINGMYGNYSVTLLVYSIRSGSNKVVEFLLSKGADPNIHVEFKNPLMYAILEGSRSKINTLLDYNANINDRDPEGNHALIYAAIHGDVTLIKILLKHGAYLNLKNNTRLTAYDHAVKSNNSEAAKYLKLRYEKNLPEFQDGPYISWLDRNTIRAMYLYHDSIKNTTKKISRSFKTKSDSFLINGFFRDDIDYLVFKENSQSLSEFKNIDKILIIGDIHGGYDSLVKFLMNNNVIDSKMNWNWEDGHLVFLGDIFDRGDKVTEALWLIYKLEHQAQNNGGYVHLLLGNHEILVLLKNQMYVTDKYYYLCKKLRFSYGSLYSKNSVLGDWLRSKNTMIKIDDKLFVHAGISPEIVSQGLSRDTLNEMVRFFLNHPERNRKYGLNTKEFILGMKGPFWYRGYLEDNHQVKRISEQELDLVCDFYKVSKIFVGHSNVEEITGLYDGKVFMMDVPFYSYTSNIKSLLFENESLYLLDSGGKKIKFE